MSVERPEDERPPKNLPEASGTQPTSANDAEVAHEAVARRRRSISPLWLVPLGALGLLAYLAYEVITTHGPTITVTFNSADGLRVEQTQVKYKAVALGTVQNIVLSDDATHVSVEIKMNARAEPMLTENTRLWVVKPRLGAGGMAALQGLETLVSGSYIEIDPGEPNGAPKRSFEGLEQPPAVRSGEPGTTFVLNAEKIGAIGAGSPVLHRQVPVGEIIGYTVDPKSGVIALQAFVRTPYDRLVTAQTRFWNVSGLDIGMGADGLHVEIASVRALLSGGIAFHTPGSVNGEAPAPAPGLHAFPLYGTEALAEATLHEPSIPYLAYFKDSVQGLAPGAAVKLFGVQVGNVSKVSLTADPRVKGETRLVARVAFVLQPSRALEGSLAEALHPERMRSQVRSGMRIVLETSSLLTGERVLSLRYVPGNSPGDVFDEEGVLVLPSQAQGLDALTTALGDVAAQLASIPFAQIGRDLSSTLQGVDRKVVPELARALDRVANAVEEVHGLARDARAGLAPALARLPTIADEIEQAVASAHSAVSNVGDNNGTFQRSAQRTLNELSEMARSVRMLSDFLERHPEALLRGRDRKEQP